jgi:hypothetical protein
MAEHNEWIDEPSAPGRLIWIDPGSYDSNVGGFLRLNRMRAIFWFTGQSVENVKNGIDCP